ncbi:MAG: homoserine dehydrogenase [Bacteroidetes bacterium]|nr:MAG: homoserine dehydrogenase [Bacteroidota bacterium]
MINKNNKQIIGLFGFGVVGEGLFHVLKHSHTTNATIKKICILDPKKERSLSKDYFTIEAADILDDKEINLVVELINDSEDAFHIVSQALRKGKSVVSGNKKMLAAHLPELIQLQKETGAALLYDASACGSIPVIRNLEEYYDNDLLLSITGILNGSSNFVLSKIFNEKKSYPESVKEAQRLGFAEADPSLDMGGWDSLYKLVILAVHGFGALVNPDDVFVSGIANLQANDIRFAREKGYRLKLVAQATKVNGKRFNLMVMPKMVTEDEYIYNVENEYNGVIIEGSFYEKQFMFGKGAGGHPTGSSVLSDITARMHGYRYEYKKRKYFSIPEHTNDVKVKVYLRFKNLLDFSHFEFEEIEEKLSGREYSYVIGSIKLSNLIHIRKLIQTLDVFLAFFEEPAVNESAIT